MADNNVLELEKTLQVDGQTYNINANHSDTASKVVNKLIFKKTNLDGSESAQNIHSFDGSSELEMVLVPADGGGFTGRITVPDYTNMQIDPKAVLNSSDIKKFIVNELKNNSVLAEWNGTNLTVGGEGTSVKSISIITGDDANKDSFAAKNHNDYTAYYTDNKTSYFSAFIYISDDNQNKGNIYFGICTSDKVVGVQVNAENANTASQLATTQEFSVSLNSDNTNVSFNGTQDVQLGVVGTLPIDKGGTGATTIEAARANLGAAAATHSHDTAYAQKVHTHFYAGSSTAGGAATKAVQDDAGHTIASYYQPKILTGTVDPNSSTVTAVKDAPNGAIYIKY